MINILKLWTGISILFGLAIIHFDHEYRKELELCTVPYQLQSSPWEVTASYLVDDIHSLNDDMSYGDAIWFATVIAKASHIEGVPVEILLSTVSVESTFNVHARSRKNAIGSAQVMPFWASKTPYNIYDHEGNILAGAYILSHYREECGDWKCAVKSYNVGLSAYRKGKKKVEQNVYLNKVNFVLASIGHPRII
jgi:hypothetical protein